MATKTQIANYALAHIGDIEITSIDDTSTKPARKCSLLYAQARDTVLQSYRWSSCKRQTSLSPLATTPLYKWKYDFALPSDFLRLCEVQGRDAFYPQQWFDIQGQTLLLNTTYGETEGQSVAIEYIARIDDPSGYDPLLVEAISLMLASMVAKSLTGSDGKSMELLELYERTIAPKAQTIDAQQRNSNENSPVRQMMTKSALLNSRRHSSTNSSYSGTPADL